jgi:hypothetical protein
MGPKGEEDEMGSGFTPRCEVLELLVRLESLGINVS